MKTRCLRFFPHCLLKRCFGVLIDRTRWLAQLHARCPVTMCRGRNESPIAFGAADVSRYLIGFVVFACCLSSASTRGQESVPVDAAVSENSEESSVVVEAPLLVKEAGWRFQVAADYTKLYGNYTLRSDFLPYEIDGDRDGDAYGAVLGVSFPSWEESSWLEFTYRTGELTGQNEYTSFFTGETLATSDITSDLTEFGLGFRYSTKRMAGGLSFQYQDWSTEEVAAGRLSYNDTLYLLNFDFGPHWEWKVGGGVELGVRLLFGTGIGYGAAGRPDLDNGMAGNFRGTGSGNFQWAVFGPPSHIRLFAEGGVTGMFYYTASGDYYLSENQMWGSYGPFGKAGLRIDF